jgi:hypothetical protein
VDFLSGSTQRVVLVSPRLSDAVSLIDLTWISVGRLLSLALGSIIRLDGKLFFGIGQQQAHGLGYAT